jgi:hypothetical protein
MIRALLVILIALTAAAIAPASGHAKSSQDAASKPASPKPGETRRAAGADQSKTVTTLLGLTEAEAKAKLGAPDAARDEGSGAMWTYRLDDCALFVFFKAEDDKPLKVSGTASGARRRGEAAPPVQGCIADALKR